MKRTPLKRSAKPLKKSAMKKSRSKPRPNRLKGGDMTALRLEVFARDGYRCQHIVETYCWGPEQRRNRRCLKHVTFENGHLAHIRNKRMWGDSPENCTTKCAEHHLVNEHAYGPSGEKPVPSKR